MRKFPEDFIFESGALNTEQPGGVRVMEGGGERGGGGEGGGAAPAQKVTICLRKGLCSLHTCR